MNSPSVFVWVPRREAGGFLMSHLSGIIGAVGLIHFSIYPPLFFCLVLSLFLSYPFMLLAHSPDLFFLKLPFSKRLALLCGSCFVCLSG